MLNFPYKYECSVLEKYFNYLLRKSGFLCGNCVGSDFSDRFGQDVFANFSMGRPDLGLNFYFLQWAMVW